MWFKARYVEDILSGRKTETLRRVNGRVPAVGTVAPASVGPVRPFAWLHIDAVDIISVSDLSEERRTEIETLLGPAPTFQRVRFHVVQVADYAAHNASASLRDNFGPT